MTNYNGMYVNNNYCPCMNNYLNNPREMNSCPNSKAQYSPVVFTINQFGTYPTMDDDNFPYVNPPVLRIRSVSIEELRE